MRKLKSKAKKAKGLVVVGSLGALVFGTGGPVSAASAGAQTGWEYAGTGGMPCNSGLPTAGFLLPTDQFVLTDILVPASVMTIDIGPSVAAPQGAAPGDCTAVSDPVVPLPIPITNVAIAGTGACTAVNPALSFFTRVNTTVNFEFECGTTLGIAVRYVITGNLNVCSVPFPPPDGTSNPQCASNPTASGQLVTTYVSAP